MDELLSEFLTESSENLATLDVELVRLEQVPNDPELLGNIFRLVHTVKGTCGFLGLPRLGAVAHASETVLGKFRDGALEVTPAAVTLILLSIDRIKMILATLEATEVEPQGDDAELIAQLNMLAEGTAPEGLEAPAASAARAETAETPSDTGPAAGAARGAGSAAPGTLFGVMAATNPSASGASAPAQSSSEPSIANQSIRVSVGQLESLMTTVSELVLTRNQLLQMVRGRDDSEFKAPLQRLSHITTDLQEGVMKTRMQPIGNAWAKLPRIVRTLAHDLSKKIDLEMIGSDTELDRQVLELIKDPLTHMVRNSGDHGLETPAERVAAGKPETGRITLNAFHEGGHIIIEISDDGHGIDLERVKAKVLANGLATQAEIDAMTDRQIYQHIFNAGFSTAAEVTSVSGRGVGMDVVRSNIERIGGTVSLSSTPGKGSTFTITIPLTLAIVSALIVEAGGERFAIPQISVLELVRAKADSEHKIELINGTPILRLRDRLLPLVSLATLLQLRAETPGGERGDSESEIESDLADPSGSQAFIVVTQVGAYTFGIIVDRVFDTEEIVVKPVSPILRDISLFSGNTILGDGSIIMILDPNGIAASTGQRQFTEGMGADVDADADAGADGRRGEKTAMLMFRSGGQNPKAVPLALVARLEEIDADKIEYSDGKAVVQYRGQLMPLIPVEVGQPPAESGRQPIVVFTDRERSMGLLVDEIVDIVEETLDLETSSSRSGLIGSAVIAGKATDLIDVGHYLNQCFGDWFGAQANQAADKTRRLLLVDDSPFFRNLLTPILTAAGYEVTTAPDADMALQMREQGEGFDIIVSDIEMPGMSGFDFAEACRSDTRWRQTPLVALSSHAESKDFERGREVGFSDYVAKFDRDALISALTQTLSIARSEAA